jgi:outer membrane protein assembly factor BamA
MTATDRVIGGVSSSACRWVAVLGAGLACTAAALAQAPAGKVFVADVIVQGNQNVPTQKILSLIRTHAGAEYSADVVAEDVRRLYKETQSFQNIRVAEKPTGDGKVVVYFQVVELPSVVQEIVYQGAKHLKPDELESLTGLHKGVPLNPMAVKLAREAILRRYQEMGRLAAGVEVLEGNKTGDTRIVFGITEGPVVKIATIDFAGNEWIGGERLRTQINSSRTFFGIGGTYNPLMADLDVSKIEEYYRGFGFHDVKVARELQWDGDQQRVHITYHIQEGRQYKIAKVDLQGVPAKERQELLKLNTLHAGDVYNQSKIDADKGKMKDYIGYTGRDDAIQEAVFYPPDRPGEVVVNYEVQERPPFKVGQIIIVGNDVTRQNVILRQVPLYPGQTLTYPDLRVAERNLARLNIFEAKPETGIRPTVSILDPDSDSIYKDVMVNVQETQTGSLLFGVGVNSDAGLTGSIVYNERNFDILRPPTSLDDVLSMRAFRGAGQEFRIEAVPGTSLQRYTISFREPYLFDSLYSLGLSAYYFERQYNEDLEERLGFRATIGRKLNQYWTATGTLRVEDVGIHNVPFFAPPDYTSVTGQNLLVGLRAGVTRDTRDSFLRPTEGSLLDFSYEQCLGDFTFPLFNVEANKYFTVYQRPDGSGRQVLAARSQIGFAGDTTPVYERFFAGGFRSMRGFEFRGVGPFINGFNVGGDFMWLNSLEYQIPLVANDQLYFVGFVDSGTVESSVEIKNYRVSAGVGLRIVVPLLGPVPIALDFGFPIVKAAQDRDQIFSFWVGFFH